MSKAIQALLREPAPVMDLDMGLGSREQGFAAPQPKRERFILSEQAAAAEPAEETA